MYQLASIHENQLTPFHRSQYIITLEDFNESKVFKGIDYDSSKFFSVEMNKRFFSKASQETIANLLLTTLQIKFQQGERNFLVIYNDDNAKESMDVLNGLLNVFQFIDTDKGLTPEQTELATYAGDWSRILIEEEQKMSRIGILLNN